MKELFHSKLFKKNLAKWTIMYIGVIALLTTAITYSKYMTELQMSDSARVAKFDIDIIPIECSNSNEKDKVCNDNITYRPTTPITYSFTVNNNLEVKTALVLTIYVNDNFEVTNFTKDGEKLTFNPSKTIIDPKNNVIYTYQSIIEQTVLPGNDNSKYEITVKYKNYEEKIINNNLDYNIIKVEYSATQEKN